MKFVTKIFKLTWNCVSHRICRRLYSEICENQL